MVLQAFVDESYDQGSWFVLAGYAAPAEKWALFSSDWEELLPRFGLLDQTKDEYYFHMREMNESDERLECVPFFGRVIERHIEFMMSLRFYIPDIAEAQGRLYVPGRQLVHFPPMSEIYRLGWNQLLATFGNNRTVFSDAIPVDSEVSFIFDHQSDARKFLKVWAEKERGYPLLSSIYEAVPRFEDDRKFLPLQAADMLAWRVRRSCRQDGSSTGPTPAPYPLWKNPKPMKFLDMVLPMDGMVEMLMEGTAEDLPSNLEVIDRKSGRALRGRAS